MPDIIFIGAGPIGLLGAIQLKLQSPEKEVLMFEKYAVPVRGHAMYVDPRSFAGMDRSRGFGEILDSIPSKVIINELEKTLRTFAASIGITIEFEEIRNFNELKSRYPDTEYFVGSGGLRGIIHPQVFNNKNQINEMLRYAVEVKYKASGATRGLHKVTELPGILANCNHMVSEYVGRERDGVTPVSLRIFIDEATSQSMKDATFRSPFTLEDEDRIPPDLYRSITRYLSGRYHLANESIVEGSLKISALTLSIYASQTFCAKVDGRTIFQIGEEGFACPFYRSFNDNAMCVPFFGKAMKALFENRGIASETFSSQPSSSSLFGRSSISATRHQDPLEYYQEKVQQIVTSEIRVISALNFGLSMLETSVASSRITPMITGSSLSFRQGGRDFLAEGENGEPHKSTGCVLI